MADTEQQLRDEARQAQTIGEDAQERSEALNEAADDQAQADQSAQEARDAT